MREDEISEEEARRIVAGPAETTKVLFELQDRLPRVGNGFVRLKRQVVGRCSIWQCRSCIGRSSCVRAALKAMQC